MERAGELASLPFTYTAGTTRPRGWGAGGTETGVWDWAWAPGYRVPGLQEKCLGPDCRSEARILGV